MTSQLGNGEVQTRGREACRAEGYRAKATAGQRRVVGDGMVKKGVHVKQGDLRRRVGTVFMLAESRRAVNFAQETEPS